LLQAAPKSRACRRVRDLALRGVAFSITLPYGDLLEWSFGPV